jgi:hypothetical protein
MTGVELSAVRHLPRVCGTTGILYRVRLPGGGVVARRFQPVPGETR